MKLLLKRLIPMNHLSDHVVQQVLKSLQNCFRGVLLTNDYQVRLF